MLESPGEVADGETIATPFGAPTFLAIAPVTPEQSAPMMATTLSELTKRSAAAVAAEESTQVESARNDSIVRPPSSFPESDASEKASSAEAAIAGVRDSIGPVKPKITATLIVSLIAAA